MEIGCSQEFLIMEASNQYDINNLRSPNTQNEVLAISPNGAAWNTRILQSMKKDNDDDHD